MGSRGRSIRLRIYLLVAIPLVAMVGLLAYVAGTTISNAVSVDRAPNLINATAVPAANFARYLQAERAAAVVYLFRPTPANLQAYGRAIANTTANQAAFTTAMTSGATVNGETPSEASAIAALNGDLDQLPALREGVKAKILTPIQAFGAYTQGMTVEPKLFLAEANSVSDTSELGQALGLIAAVQANEQLSEEDALLAGMLAGQRMTTRDLIAFTQMAAARQADTQNADTLLSPANLAIYNASLAGSGAMQQDLARIEQAIAAGVPVAKLPVTQAQWQQLTGTLLQDQYNGGVAVAKAILVADHKVSHQAWVKVGVSSGIVLLGLLVTILVTTLVARSIIRRLSGLERSALTLAEDQLPDVVGRLRRGEDVDVAAEAPPLRIGRDEIGRVGQAFDLVRQTAIRAAVDEAKLRQGLNDVFRSLARRSQSLLHRQLALLDQMERRANDPEALDDLFRLDHLTTRMRRHAEGLVILAGAPPGRGWSSPVRMVDVMRGAIAEVEDYARVSVATRSQAALAGSAVADVIHLLAELIENATTMSPPYTSVRVSGDTVANGFAIEAEDRGLGMSQERLTELNERLADPPEFNPSDSEQLGLFVVSQLAKRHGIRVTLKASPYGGTSAIVLIPRHLVVTEDAFRAGLPGEPAALGLVSPAANGNHAAAELAGSTEFLALGDVPEMELPGAPGVRISGPMRRLQGIAPTDLSGGAHAAGAPGGPRAGTGPEPGAAELAGGGEAAALEPSSTVPAVGAGPQSGWLAPGAAPENGAAPEQDTVPAIVAGQPDFDVFMPRRRAGGSAETLMPAEADPGRAPGSAGSAGMPGAGTSTPQAGHETARDISPPAYPDRGLAPHPGPDLPPYPSPLPLPAGAEVQGVSSGSYPDQPAPFPGWTSAGVGGGSRGAGPPSTGNRGAPATPMTPVASPPAGQVTGPPWELSPRTGPLPGVPADGDPGTQADGPGQDAEVKGLPRRIKQASLAPQLRANPPRRRTTTASGVGAVGGPTPTEIRQSMSALQRGWQEGRSQGQEERPLGEEGRSQGQEERPLGQEGRSQRPAGPASDGPPPEPPADPGGGESQQQVAADEPGGESDGT